MTRTLTAALKAEFTAVTLRPIILTSFEFDEATIFFWAGISTLNFNGDDYIGVGNLLQIQPAEENTTLEARGASFDLSGVPSSLITSVLTSEYQGRPCKISIGALDGSNTIVVDPVNVFSGVMDVMSVEDDPVFPVISLSAESDLVTLNRARDRRYTHEDQQVDFSGDLAFEFVPHLQDAEINWGNG